MKRLFLVVLSFVLSFGVVGCKKGFDCSAYLSENRTDTFTAEVEGGLLTADTGTRETPYKVDGTSGDKEEFTVITFTPNDFIPGKTYGYSAVIDGTVYEGDMVMHPFGSSYSADIKDCSLAKEIPVKIIDGETAWETTLTSVLQENMIGASRALEVGRNALSAEFDRHIHGGKLDGEVYVRIISNPVTAAGGYYWYVALTCEKTCAVLIDPVTEEVIAKRE